MSAIIVCKTHIKTAEDLKAAFKELGYTVEMYKVNEKNGDVDLTTSHHGWRGNVVVRFVEENAAYSGKYDGDYEYSEGMVESSDYKKLIGKVGYQAVVNQAFAAAAAKKKMRSMGMAPKTEVRENKMVVYADY